MNTTEFTQNYTLVYDKMYAFAFKLTRDENKAKDLVQEAAYKAYKNIKSFRRGTNFKAWLSTILRNTFINDYRRKKVRNITSEPVEDVMYKVEERFNTENKATSNLQMEELNSLFDVLSDKYRTPFLMFYKGFEYQEIADEMNIPIGTVKSRLFVARRKLRTAVKEKYSYKLAS